MNLHQSNKPMLRDCSEKSSTARIVKTESLFPNLAAYELLTPDKMIKQIEELKHSRYSRANSNSYGILSSAMNSYGTSEFKKSVGCGFDGQLVVDLGAGKSSIGYQLASEMGARGYLGVDLWHVNDLLRNIEECEVEKQIPAAVVRGHLVDLLKALPSNSCAVLCSGLDNIILTGPEAEDAGIQIERVLSTSAVFASVRSTIPTPKLHLQSCSGDIWVWKHSVALL